MGHFSYTQQNPWLAQKGQQAVSVNAGKTQTSLVLKNDAQQVFMHYRTFASSVLSILIGIINRITSS